MKYFLVIAATGILFLFIVASFAFRPEREKRLFGILLTIAGIIGAIGYGYGFATIYDNAALAVVRSVFDVFCMFIGRQDVNAVSGVYPLNTPLVLGIFYMAHIIAIYGALNAFITMIGQNILRELNLRLPFRGELVLIYGINGSTVSLGEQVTKDNSKEKPLRKVVFIGKADDSQKDRIMKMGGLLLSDDSAWHPNSRLVKRLGMQKTSRTLRVICLDEDFDSSRRFCRELKQALIENEIDKTRVSLTAMVSDEAFGREMTGNAEEEYGFGSVWTFERYDMAARLLMRNYPPHEKIELDANGIVSTKDFHALIVGFGKTGQAVLRQLAMNCQFEGCRLHVDIISKDYASTSGAFFHKYPGLDRHKEYLDLKIMTDNAKSNDTYEHLKNTAHELDYAVICVGDDAANRDIAYELGDYLRSKNDKIWAIICSVNGVTPVFDDMKKPLVSSFSSKEVLIDNKLDELAADINYSYAAKRGEQPTRERIALEWNKCSYYGRTSSRAAADFRQAFRKWKGFTQPDGIRSHPELFEYLCRTEHKRWCGFMLSMGYDTMSIEELTARAEAHAQNTQISAITKDEVKKLHACLVPWEKLDEVSKTVKMITGKHVNFKENDESIVESVFAQLGSDEK